MYVTVLVGSFLGVCGLVGLCAWAFSTPSVGEMVVSTESLDWAYAPSRVGDYDTTVGADKGDFTGNGVPYVVGSVPEENEPEWEGATEEWSPKESMRPTDAWLEAMNEEDERFLTELDHSFTRLMMSDPDVDADYEAFVQRSMQLQAYRNFRLEHTGEMESIR